MYIRQNEGSLMDVEHAEMVEKQLDAMIQRRARKGEVDPDDRDELWEASVKAYNDERRQMARLEWRAFHCGQAERHRVVLEAMIANHEAAAAQLREAEASSGRWGSSRANDWKEIRR